MGWLTPRTVPEAVAQRSEYPDATVVAGGTFLGILVRQGLLESEQWLSLSRVAELRVLSAAGDLSVGAMVTHRALELDQTVTRSWPGIHQVFSVVASRRVRTVATVGGVLGDADYASDPPAMLVAYGAWAEAVSVRGTRRIPVEDLIVGHYETSLADDELIARVVVPRGVDRAVYRKLRTRSSEDRPAVAVAGTRTGAGVRVVVGAVTGRPQYFADLCAAWTPEDPERAEQIADAYAQRIDPIDDSRGSADYRRHAVAVEVRRVLEELRHD